MSNEELVQLYYQGDQDALSQLCQKNEKLIISLAHKAAASYCYNDTEDLCSVGMLAFLELLNSKTYNPEKTKLSTYFYPHIQGFMYRHIEKNTGSISLTKYQMDLVRKAQQLHHEVHMAVDAVAKELGISSARAAMLINHNTRPISFDELYDEDQNCPFTESVDHTVLKNIQIELLEEQFRQLSAKDQYILGSYCGVFGYVQKSVDTLALEEILTVDGVHKAKEAAWRRLQKLCRNSAIPLWRQVHILTQKAAQGK